MNRVDKYYLKEEQEVFDLWFNFYKDKKVTGKMGSNRDEAFFRGYKNLRLSNNRKFYNRTSLLRIIYDAGLAVRRHQNKHPLKPRRRQ